MVLFGVQYNGVSLGRTMGPLEFAEKAEAWGYDSLFVPDLVTLPTLDALTILASAAQRTSRLKLGTGVLVLPFRSPYQLAKTAASIDVLSNGRLILGLGTGGVIPKDFEAEQVDMGQRGSIMDERLDILRRLLSEPQVSHHGKHHRFDNLALEPRPVQQPHFPLWIGATWHNGFAPAAVRRTARWGDGFHPHDTPLSGYAEAQRRIEEQAASIDRDPGAIEWACNMWLCMGKNKDQALRNANAALARRFGADAWEVEPQNCYALGTPDDCIETVQSYADLGVSHMVMNVLGTPEQMLETCESFADQVALHFRNPH